MDSFPLIDYPHCEPVKKIKAGMDRCAILPFQNGIKYSSEPELANSRVEGGEQEYQSIHEGTGESMSGSPTDMNVPSGSGNLTRGNPTHQDNVATNPANSVS